MLARRVVACHNLAVVAQPEWQVEAHAGDDAAYQVLARDRAWNGYAIADLDEPFRRYAQVAVARRRGAHPAALLVLRHPGFTAVNSHGPAAGVAAVLEELGRRGELPASTHFLVRLSHRRPLARFYVEQGHEMLRLVATARTFHPPPETRVVAERLAPADLEALADLYRDYPANAFAPDQLDGGVFYGVRDTDGRLLAAGGTHVVSRRHAIAAVGNIFTRTRARGQGFGAAVTAAVTAELLDGLCRQVILNVAVDNGAARRVYQRLGFRQHVRYWEGSATLRRG